MASEQSAATGLSVQARHANSPWAVGVSKDIQLDTSTATSAPNPTADVASQRCRGMADDAQDRVATVPTADALITS